MNDFIVWDVDNNKFLDNELFENQIFRDTKGNVCWFSYKGINKVDNYKAFDYIEKNDIEGNKIYANSSIVGFELDWTSRNISREQKGYFSYNPDYACYDWVDLTNNRIVRLGVHFNHLKNIKIIDTIQQNKLGLIKS